MKMDPPAAPESQNSQNATVTDAREAPQRRQSMSQQSEDSQTAADFIRDQMQLEADAREALPYSIENCTKQLGSLRQNVFACLTCNPPPENATDPFKPAGVCYACSVQCHGEHELVEIFQKRNFTCDCGTTRFKPENPCTLRMNPETNTKGGVHSETPDPHNKYNQNFRNRFCSCSIDYKPMEQKGTMFQCLGLGTHETGGCGEDWYHPGCLVGMGPKWYEKMNGKKPAAPITTEGALPSIAEDGPADANGTNGEEEEDDDPPLPEGFPEEDDFEQFICYKCVESNPWIKRYADTPGFLLPVFFQKEDGASSTKKRKLDEGDEASEQVESQPKRIKSEQPEGPETSTTATVEQIPIREAEAKPAKEEDATTKEEDTTAKEEATTVKEEETKESVQQAPVCKLNSLPPAPSGQFSLFVTAGFRDRFCRCPDCFPSLRPHPQILEEEEVYEPPVSEGASDNGSTHGSGSLYERGESALRNVDRVRAIEGVMAYNHLKDKLKPFFQQFVGTGKAISAEDIKEYFAKLRGDQQAIQEAGEAANSDNRQEQSGY